MGPADTLFNAEESLAQGVTEAIDAAEGHPLDENDVAQALSYYTTEATDYTRQSPNKKDVVRIVTDGEEGFVAKRFLT
ncbi:hypothetical protein HPB47_020481 [Ixodes persulcatus]|uniref:Uncharacterized protein n=1 Tax=Ixodes persulcatus TaxID=34615 RepID=A0AC60QF82_IXOPE|nr:hypothetical protein HPB47_020481 [Ixodes persulcatus]